MKAFETAGTWWLPDRPDEQVVGVLRFAPEEGFKLEIPIGALGTRADFISRANNPIWTSLVHGVLRTGKAATLVNAVCRSMTLTMPGSETEEYVASHAFIGDTHTLANPSVDLVRVEYSHLRDWVADHPLSSTHLASAQTKSEIIDYRYQPMGERRLAAADGWSLNVRHKTLLPIPSVEGFNVQHDCDLELSLTETIDFEDLDRQFLGPIWRFLCFALDQMIRCTLLRVRVSGTSDWLTVGRVHVAKEDDVQRVIEPFMLLSLAQLGERVDDVITRWLRFEGDQRRAVSLLVGLGRKRGVPSDLRFLAAAQALEAMARVDATEEELTEEEFQRRLSVVESALLEDTKICGWAARKLKYANQRSASDLITDLAIFVGGYIAGLAPDTQRFVSDVRENRNFYTHRDDRRASRILEGGDLHLLTEAVICFLKATVIRRLGFTEEETERLLGECQGVLRYKALVADAYSRCEQSEA